MFVDDEVRVLEALRRSLRKRCARWDMTFYADSQEALEAFYSKPSDVVVTDMKMPGMNGIQLVQAMRRVGSQTSYVVLTGTADLRTAIDAINTAGIFRFFTKPCPSFLLMEGIEAALAASVTSPPSPPALGEPALDRLTVAVLVVDKDARVLFMNRRGASLCAAEDGVMLGVGKVCRGANAEETKRLHALISLAISEGDGGVMTLSRSQSGPLSVAVTVLEEQDDRTARVGLYISDPNNHLIPTVGQLTGLLDLTHSEARLAHALALGRSLEEAAEASGITIGTARGYLKQIFGKTGKSRQAELVRLILSLPVVTD